jgi:hypothetical protein
VFRILSLSEILPWQISKVSWVYAQEKYVVQKKMSVALLDGSIRDASLYKKERSIAQGIPNMDQMISGLFRSSSAEKLIDH